jgi:flagellar export protein FliJ
VPFQFPLETLLRYRHNTEKREWLKLQGIAQRLARLRNQLEGMRQMQVDVRVRNAGDLLQGLRAAEIQFNAECETVFQQRLAEVRQRCADVEKEHTKQMRVFRDERQKREVLEKLREGEYQRYRQERERREQNQADELFLLRRAMSRG